MSAKGEQQRRLWRSRTDYRANSPTPHARTDITDAAMAATSSQRAGFKHLARSRQCRDLRADTREQLCGFTVALLEHRDTIGKSLNVIPRHHCSRRTFVSDSSTSADRRMDGAFAKIVSQGIAFNTRSHEYPCR